MSAPSRKAKRNPRRKAGKASRKSSPRKHVFNLVVEAQKVRVVYTPDFISGRYAMGSFLLESPYTPRRPIPGSAVGHMAHLASMKDIRRAGSPQAYARQVILAELREVDQRAKGYDSRQLGLF